MIGSNPLDKCPTCGGKLDSFKHQATCVGPLVEQMDNDNVKMRAVYLDEKTRLQAKLDAALLQLGEERAKYLEQEREYILPLFGLAKEMGFDLQKAVFDNPGKGCNQLFIAKIQEMNRLNGELWDHLMNAWGVIANAGPEGCLGNWKKMEPQWVEVAEKWRDKWHDMRKALRVPLDQVIEELDKTEKPKYGCDCGATVAFPAHQPGCPLHSEYALKREHGCPKCDHMSKRDWCDSFNRCR